MRILLHNIEDIEIFNKKAVYLYLRELTGLNTKQVVNNLNKLREKYRSFKTKWDKSTNFLSKNIYSIMSKKVEDLIEQAKGNITEDRAATKTLLMALMKYMQSADDRHREVGLVAAKYLETLQRSNEQLVKLAALVKKGTKENQRITEEDKEDLFDLIREESSDTKSE